ncbi:hypothetical protein DEO18_23255 [Escherichia coli]|nr:hypothetical protein DEO18_23255 [Escherichia coli]TJG53201.1 hypothetical protein C9177_24385 [Escherichia coli]GDL40954.1 hypothetical protein BvCmsKSP015_00399 [Escherichia coli]GDO85930.1 hypothetical protein BvCmsNSP003_03838 [Escherichia coli]GDW73650.1 hypothetical protein BvCmsSIP004_02027 [Escherichia coli]
MSGNSQHLSELFIIFIIAFLSIVVSFLCIDVFFSLVEWLITGNLNISLKVSLTHDIQTVVVS